MRRSVHCTALFSVCSLRRAKFPIIYPDLRLDYKVATHPIKVFLNRVEIFHFRVWSGSNGGPLSAQPNGLALQRDDRATKRAQKFEFSVDRAPSLTFRRKTHECVSCSTRRRYSDLEMNDDGLILAPCK